MRMLSAVACWLVVVNGEECEEGPCWSGRDQRLRNSQRPWKVTARTSGWSPVRGIHGFHSLILANKRNRETQEEGRKEVTTDIQVTGEDQD